MVRLTHWGRVTHICVSRLTIIGSDNGLSPWRHQAIIWTNAGILLIGPLGANFSENLIEILTFSFTKVRLKVSSAKWRPFCFGLNVLRIVLSKNEYGGWVHICVERTCAEKRISLSHVPELLSRRLRVLRKKCSSIRKDTRLSCELLLNGPRINCDHCNPENMTWNIKWLVATDWFLSKSSASLWFLTE